MSSSERGDGTTVIESRSAWAEELDSTVEELTAELASVRGERDAAWQWVEFLDQELREYREDLEDLEERVEALEDLEAHVDGLEILEERLHALESEPSLFDRIQELLG